MQNLEPNYIIGLVDGEGSFTVYVRDPYKKGDRRVMVEPKFYVKIIEKDKKVLNQLKKFFNCGKVYIQNDKRPNHQTCYRYEVFNRKDLINIIIPFFKKNKLRFPSKSKDFIIFCKIMKLIEKGCHLNDKGLRQLFELKQQMH